MTGGSLELPGVKGEVEILTWATAFLISVGGRAFREAVGNGGWVWMSTCTMG